MSDPALIMLVDDEPNVRLMFRVALESAGHRCLEAGDGGSALAELEQTEVDLVLLDLRMPGMDGIATLRALRDSGSDVPVVFITAYGSVPNAVEAMKLGAIDFLGKPLNPESLRRVVLEILERHGDRPAASTPPVAETASAALLFENHLAVAKRCLNRCRFPEAEVALKQALGLVPDSAEAHNLMGVLHELRDEHDASYRHYKAALKASRDYEPAQHNMTRYYERVTFGSSTVPVDLGAGRSTDDFRGGSRP